MLQVFVLTAKIYRYSILLQLLISYSSSLEGGPPPALLSVFLLFICLFLTSSESSWSVRGVLCSLYSLVAIVRHLQMFLLSSWRWKNRSPVLDAGALSLDQLVSVLLVIAFLEEGAKNSLPGGERPDPLRCVRFLALASE